MSSLVSDFFHSVYKAFKSCPCGCVYCGATFPGTNMPGFVYSFTHWRTVGLFPVGLLRIKLLWTFMFKSSGGHGFSFFPSGTVGSFGKYTFKLCKIPPDYLPALEYCFALPPSNCMRVPVTAHLCNTWSCLLFSPFKMVCYVNSWF